MNCSNISDQLEGFFLFCEAEKIRLSVKCKVLLRALDRMSDFIDAESLWLQIKNENEQISRATVYKILYWLSARGYVVRKKADRAGFSLFKLNFSIPKEN